jgi:hypothetical protein
MVYTKDTRLFRYQLESFGAGPHADHLWAGHGSWLFSAKPDDALAQLAIAARSGLGGDALFSYDAIADSPALLAALVGEWEQRSRVETLPAEPAGIDPLASGPSAGE